MEGTVRYLGIIPARLASSRFPAKPLAMLGGKPVVQHVYERVSKVLDYVWVATDSESILRAVEAYGGRAVMTSETHRSGTDRCREALEKISALALEQGGGPFDVVVNVQGDEPFIAPGQVRALACCFDDPATEIATLVKPFRPGDGWEALANPNSPKVVVDCNGYALYFSRSVIPYMRDKERGEWLSGQQRQIYYKHIGIYAYRADVLRRITELPQSPLELAESLEQLRWLENGLRIKTAQTDVETIGIDTPEDLDRAEKYLREHPWI